MAEGKVVSDLRDLKNISTEIKTLNAQKKLLSLKKKDIEDRIMNYLQEVDQPGVKFGDLVVLSKERTTHIRLKKKEKEENAIKVLEEIGVVNAHQTFQHMMDSMKGEETVVQSLQLKESKM